MSEYEANKQDLDNSGEAMELQQQFKFLDNEPLDTNPLKETEALV